MTHGRTHTLAEAAPENVASAYDTDFVRWSAEQARLVRAGRWRELDIDNLAEEIESLGISQRHEIGSRLNVILEHLLKWHFQPDKRKYGWRSSLIEQRSMIEQIVSSSPSLRRQPAEALSRSYSIGRIRAASDTGLPERTFPVECPYTVEQVLDHAFYPGPEEKDVV